ncbi:MAG: hypothetical protein OXO52_18435 [Rhodospirillales bacterium]|nr:hypothetical protein [Rhodospirillales bacterium]MDE0379590.1 hypothetical protein [Rhodospirillales bacterium]
MSVMVSTPWFGAEYRPLGYMISQQAATPLGVPPGARNATGNCNRPSGHYATQLRIVNAGGHKTMTNPLTSLTQTVVMGVILTVIIVAILYGIS